MAAATPFFTAFLNEVKRTASRENLLFANAQTEAKITELRGNLGLRTGKRRLNVCYPVLGLIGALTCSRRRGHVPSLFPHRLNHRLDPWAKFGHRFGICAHGLYSLSLCWHVDSLTCL